MMADEDNANLDGQDLLKQVEKDFDKQTREKVKGNLKNLLAEQKKAEQALRLINAKIQKYLSEYEAGTLVFDEKK